MNINMRNRIIVNLLGCVVAALSFGACVTIKNAFVPPKFVVTPNRTVLSHHLVREPVTFSGSGWKPKEMVIVEMVLPPALKVKDIKKGEKVGLAFAKADEEGNFTAKMAPTATLNWFFRMGLKPIVRPDFKQARPLPPGAYTIKASGIYSGLEARATLTILLPLGKDKAAGRKLPAQNNLQRRDPAS